MNHMDNSDAHGDSTSFHEQSYYESLDALHEHDVDYSTGEIEQRSPLREQIAKEAKECVQECVSEFISFITSEAAERCTSEKRKTINGEDILCAMNSLGFDNYVDPLKAFLVKFREISKIETSYEADSSIAAANNAAALAAAAQTHQLVAGGQQITLLAATAPPTSRPVQQQFVNGTTVSSSSASSLMDVKSVLGATSTPSSVIGQVAPQTIILPISSTQGLQPRFQLALVNGTPTALATTTAEPTSDATATS